jgi:hypothetical protein
MVKLTPLLATPPTVTTTFPVVAPVGTEVTMVVEFQLVVVAAVPLNFTVPEDPKFVPVIVTVVPAPPDVGVRLVIDGVAAAVTVSVRVAVPVPVAFVALSVTVEVPAAVGVPEINPLPVFTDSPAGNPVALKLVGEFVAMIWYEKAVPTVPLAVVPLVITGGAVIVSVSVAVPVPLAFVALSVTIEVPAAVGVPEINPLPVFTDSPAGNPVASKLVGEFVAMIWYEKAAPTVPLAVVPLVIAGAAVIVSVSVALPVPAAFVALSVTIEVPAAVGVPEINPLPVFTDSPAGNPVALKLVGEFVAMTWYEKAVPTVPLAVVPLVIIGATKVTVSVRVAVPVPVAFVALSVTVEVPAAVGVPEINPLPVFTDSPAGNPVALKLVGEFVAVIW